MVLQFVAEDITQFEERTGDWRRSFLAALLASVDTVFPALVKVRGPGLCCVLWDNVFGHRHGRRLRSLLAAPSARVARSIPEIPHSPQPHTASNDSAVAATPPLFKPPRSCCRTTFPPA